MSTSGPTFKISSQSKRLVSTIADPHRRGEYRRAMISAELSAAQQYKPEKPKRRS